MKMEFMSLCCSLHAGTQSRKWLYRVPSPALSNSGGLLSNPAASVAKSQSHQCRREVTLPVIASLSQASKVPRLVGSVTAGGSGPFSFRSGTWY